VAGFSVLFAFIFTFSIKAFNFQKRWNHCNASLIMFWCIYIKNDILKFGIQFKHKLIWEGITSASIWNWSLILYNWSFILFICNNLIMYLYFVTFKSFYVLYYAHISHFSIFYYKNTVK
jgi:hypothetical protein